MKIPYLMLKGFVETRLDAQGLAELLTMAGFEVEGVEEVAGDSVFEIKVCSNRGDGLSALGLAREILAKDAEAKPTKLFEQAEAGFLLGDEGQSSELQVPLQVETSNCNRFGYRGFSGVSNGNSPEWIQKRLTQAGMRPISLFVDLTNYVMLEVGQPLHAYDLKKLSGPKIGVRQAQVDERVKTLDGTEHNLDSQVMVIVDGSGPIGVAGVMGGETTEIDGSTTEILLEAAHFNHQSIRKTRKKLNLNTEASYRFERSVDPLLVTAALNRVALLTQEAGQSQSVQPGLTLFDSKEIDRSPRVLTLNLERAKILLGFDFSDEEATNALTKLGFKLEKGDGKLQVTCPSWRFDVEQEEDLIEDIGRVLGYERIEELLPAGTSSAGGVHGQYKWLEGLEDRALQLGLDEAMTHSLVGASDLSNPHLDQVAVANPASPETSFMRNSLLPGLVFALLKNAPSGRPFFEIGPVFKTENGAFLTEKSLAFAGSGPISLPNRKGDQPPTIDFFWAKSVLEALLDGLAFSQGNDPRFHPTRHAKIEGSHQGHVGQIHPSLAAKLGIPAETILAEVYLCQTAFESEKTVYYPISRTPSIRRDIAFAISKEVKYAQIESVIRESTGELLESVWLFDVYEGKGIEPGDHSLAVALTFRKHGSTFTDEEANQVRDKAVAALARLGAKQR